MNKNEDWSDIRRIADRIGDDLDTDRAWEDFNQRKKKRRMLFWLVGGGLGLLLLVTWIYLENDRSSQVLAMDIQHTQESINNHVGYEESTIDPMSSNQEATATKKVPSSSQVLTSLTPSHRLDHEVLVTDEASHNSEARQAGGDIWTSASLTIDHGSKIYVSPDLTISGDNATPRQSAQSSTETDLEDFGDQTGSEKSAAKIAHPDLSHGLHRTADTEIKQKSYLTAIPMPRVALQSLYPRHILSLMSGLEMVELEEMSDQYRKWTLGLTYELAFPTRTFDALDQSFADRRQNGERLSKAHFLSAHLERQLGRPFFIGSGLQVGLYQSRLREEIQEVLFDIEFPDQVIEILTQDGQSMEVIGTAIGSQTVIRESVRYQRYLDVRLPLYVGGVVKLGLASRIEMSTGISMGLLLSQSGNTYESYFSSGAYRSLQDLGYRSFGQLQGSLNLNYVVGLGSGWDITLGATGRLDLNSRIKDGSDLTDKFRSLGVSLGLKRKIGDF